MKYKGTGVAIVTPFKTDGSLDEPALRKLVDFQIENGTNFIVVQGSTGEAATMTASEKVETLKIVVDQNKGKLPIVLGVSDNNTARLVETLTNLDYEGVDAILSATPHYNKPSQKGIIAHFTAVAKASKRPVILYNVPGRTASNIAAETVVELAKNDNIVAIKEASGNMAQVMNILRDRPEGFAVLSGEDALTFPFIAMGGDGVVSVVANGLPKQFSTMVTAALTGDFDTARKIHLSLLKITDYFFAEGNPAGIKYFLKMIGMCEENVRLPLTTISDSLKKEIEFEFKQLFYLDIYSIQFTLKK